MDRTISDGRALVLRSGGRACAVPLGVVIETMRPLPLSAIAGAPLFVRGLATIRGVATPVVDLGALLGEHGSSIGRFVTLRVGERQVALAVESVDGVRALEPTLTAALPPLIAGASGDTVERIGALDGELLFVLRRGWELPEELWRRIQAETG